MAIWIAVVLVAGVIGAGTHGGTADAEAERARTTESTSTTRLTTTTTSTTTTTTSTTTTTEPPTTEAPPPTEPVVVDTAPPATEPVTAPAPPPAPSFSGWGLDAYAGLGSWIDVYDWTAAYGGAQISLADIDQMANDGVETLYVQPVRWDVATDLMEVDRLLPLLRRAHADGMRVVAWYLPELDDVAHDLRHLHAIADQLPIDGLAIDIESRAVEDVGERNARLMAVSDDLRASYPNQALGAIVLPPVVIDTINPAYWPSYPWADMARDYDVWLPMSYFTFRNGYWRDAGTYTAANVAGVRNHLGQSGAIVHPIGGIGDLMTVDDVNGMVAACQSQGCAGASVYDYRTMQDPQVRAAMRAFSRR